MGAREHDEDDDRAARDRSDQRGRDSLYSTVLVQADVDIEPGSGDVGLAAGDSSRCEISCTCRWSSPPTTRPWPWAPTSAEPNAFIARMNTRARELGLDDTSYVDISGRDPEDLNNDGRLPDHEDCHRNDFLKRTARTTRRSVTWLRWPVSRSTIHCSPRSSTPTAGHRFPGWISPAACGHTRRSPTRTT